MGIIHKFNQPHKYKKHLDNKKRLLFSLKTNTIHWKFASTHCCQWKVNLSRVKEMIFNFRSIAIQKPKSGLSARLENSFQGFCECHKSVSWGQKSTSWPKFQLKCVKREKTCQKLQKKCLEAGKFHCNFVRENNAQVFLVAVSPIYIESVFVNLFFLSKLVKN